MSDNIALSEKLPATPPKLLDQVRDRLRLKHYSLRTEQAYVGWIRRYIIFHDKTASGRDGQAGVGDVFDVVGSGAKCECCDTDPGAFCVAVFVQGGVGAGISLAGFGDAGEEAGAIAHGVGCG